MSTVVVLNASYEELHRVSVKKAITMLVREVAVIEEAVPDASFGPFPMPAVLRLVRYVKTAWLYRRRSSPGGRVVTGAKDTWTPVDALAGYSFEGVKVRDHHQCAYCGRPQAKVETPPPGTPAITVDHVVPRAHGGQSTWENCVAACWICNWDKADRTPEQAGLVLLWEPFVPTTYDLTWTT
ncbi:HNH endonuclease [Ornithinimicrobium murale]|uniref:HNH endonuclease n=1 Tax=Ornithinimicrobium murale TaxID=1050153 RepID=UPI000E0D08CD|nr:HNH endonuclease [Ornithinimicrobium murale]